MADPKDALTGVEGFDWDAGNSDKNWRRHLVVRIEAEQALLNRPLVAPAGTRPEGEPRFVALGRTDAGRPLTVVFTVRRNRIRVISARPMSRKERKAYGSSKAEADS